jgi:diguanylate cyclase (GGDEF)-like protein/PAS domain S-box-containing protein
MVRNVFLFIFWFFAGAFTFCALFALQNLYIEIPSLFKGYHVPFLFGGLSGITFGIWKSKFKKNNKMLFESEERFRRLYTNTPVMLHSIDRQGRLISVSNFWLETLGYEHNDVIGRKLTEFMTEESRKIAENTALPQFFGAGLVKNIPYQMIKKNGEAIDILLSAISEKDEKGEIIRSQAVAIDVTERKQGEKKIQKLAYYDTLTSLPNRTLFQDRLSQALAHARRDRRMVAVMFLDLDQFKGINDTLGHVVGDTVLRSVAQALKGCAREGDTVARLGGDEFVIVLPGLESGQYLTAFAERILDVLSQPIKAGEKELFVTASIGIVTYPLDGKNVDTLLQNADIAMYEAKDRGRNNFQFFSEKMNIKAVKKINLETHLRRALVKGEFFLVYQPQLDIQAGRIFGIEALLRWNHQNELLTPDKFIPVAEETGLIIPIGEWVLRNACIQAKAWQKKGLPPLRIAVNLSGRQFKQPGFIDVIDQILKETGLDPECLDLELTESIIMEKAGETIMTLTDLKTRGIHLSIDDFGIGYSSLSYLKHFPFDQIKIAQEFVRDIPHDQDDAAIVEAIIAMARSLNLDVIAEGVERKEQLEFLHDRHCTKMQGYYFARPMKAEDLTEIFKNGMPQEAICLFEG